MKNVQTKRADEVTAKLYELASSAGHPALDDGLDKFLGELYGDLEPRPGDGIVAPVEKPPSWLSNRLGDAKRVGGALYDSLSSDDPMGQTDSEGALFRLEEAIRRGEGVNPGAR